MKVVFPHPLPAARRNQLPAPKPHEHLIEGGERPRNGTGRLVDADHIPVIESRLDAVRAEWCSLIDRCHQFADFAFHQRSIGVFSW